MAKTPGGFRYLDDVAAFADSKALVAHVPSGMTDKPKLLKLLAKELKFPAYFGQNWDALDECLRDLSWLDGVKRVAIVHADVPFSAKGTNRAAYLGVLQNAVSSWKKGEAHELIVAFPSPLADSVTAALTDESK